MYINGTINNTKRYSFIVMIAVYLVFKYVRHMLPDGLIKYSLPSLLFLPIAFVIVDYFSDEWSLKLKNVLFSIIMSILCIECIAPLLTTKAVMDYNDMICTAIGGLVYYVVLTQDRDSVIIGTK